MLLLQISLPEEIEILQSLPGIGAFEFASVHHDEASEVKASDGRGVGLICRYCANINTSILQFYKIKIVFNAKLTSLFNSSVFVFVIAEKFRL